MPNGRARTRRSRQPNRRQRRTAPVPSRQPPNRTISKAAALQAASTIAKFVNAEHPIATATGHIGGGFGQPSFKYTKRLRAVRTAAGTNTEYIVVTPKPSSDSLDVHVKNLAAGSTITQATTTPDFSAVAPGSLFLTSDFAAGVLESRCLGFTVAVTPVGAPLNMSGVISQVTAPEDSFDGAEAIYDLIAADRRAKFVPKVKGRKIRFNYVHHDNDVITQYDHSATLYGAGTTFTPMVIAIPPDGTSAVQYLLEIVAHWEVIGTRVIGNTTPNHHNEPLFQRIHHLATTLHTQAGATYMEPEAAANLIAKQSTGFSFDTLIKYAKSAEHGIVQAGQAAQAGMSLAKTAKGAWGYVSPLWNAGKAAFGGAESMLGALEPYALEAAELGMLAL